MPLFVMIGRDGPDGEARRKENRLSHRAHLRELDEAGTIVFAGPVRDDADKQSIGAVIVFQAKSIAEARRIVEKDPYVIGGVFQFIQVSAFRQAIPKPQ